MTEAFDSFRLNAYVDGELAADEMAAIERALADDPRAASEVAALRAQRTALHARYDTVLGKPHRLSLSGKRSMPSPFGRWFHTPSWIGSSIAAALVVGIGIGVATGWLARGRMDARDLLAASSIARGAESTNEARLGDFVRVAALSHAMFVPEVRHPVEVTAADEAHLVTWLSKRLDAPLVIPHLGEAGWNLLGGRLLPADVGPVAQFMYQDAQGRRLTLAVSHPRREPFAAAPRNDASPTAAFRIAEENGNTVFYWIDAGYAYALTGKVARAEMTELAGRVYRAVDRGPERAPSR
jgi:anti-sigma factor RsiW